MADGDATLGEHRLRLMGAVAAVGMLILVCDAAEPRSSTASSGTRAAQAGRLVPAPNVPGDPVEGRSMFVSTGCAGCHTAYDVSGATGVAGPNLTNIVLRPTLASETVPMTPEILAAFVRDPGEIKPGTTMPDVGLTEEETQHVAAFLFSQPFNPKH